MKKKEPQEIVVHHIHHTQMEKDVPNREIILTGATTTISISSNKESFACLSKKALQLFEHVKKMDKNIE